MEFISNQGRSSRLIQNDVPNRGLGALVAEKFAIEGSNIAINYNASKDKAEQVAARIENEHKVRSVVIHGVCLWE